MFDYLGRYLAPVLLVRSSHALCKLKEKHRRSVNSQSPNDAFQKHPPADGRSSLTAPGLLKVDDGENKARRESYGVFQTLVGMDT